MGDLAVSVERGPDAFSLGSWRTLADAVDHPFARPRWLESWWRHFGTDLDLLVLRLRRGARDVAIVPLCVSRRGARSVRLLGGVDLTDYLGPVCAPSDEADAARAVAGWLVQGDEGATALDFRFVRRSQFSAALPPALRAAGYTVDTGGDGIVSKVPLPRSWDGYLGDLSRRNRHELRRKLRRFERVTGAPPAVRSATGDTLDTDLGTFVRMHRGSQGEKGRFTTPPVAAFLGDVASADASQGLALAFLEIAGEPAAAALGLAQGRQRFLYNMAYERDWAHVAPGIVLVAELIRQSIAAGATTFDLLRGDEAYKRRLGGQPHELVRIRAVPGEAPKT